IKPKKISQALEDESWVDAMQEELLQFKTRQVWILVDLPFGKKVIGTKRVYKNKKDERGVVVRNKESTLIETQKPLTKDEEAVDVDVHLYRSMIGSLMYLTASRPDIMYLVYACSRFQETYFMAVKKQTIVATSTTEAEYVAAASCCGQVLWIQNQMLDYGFNFMNTKIYIDSESTICIVKNPVFHSKTKHIKTRNHFIRDAYEKKLI
nr:hypothetical protein [Tanacetum cinerariifolium]